MQGGAAVVVVVGLWDVFLSRCFTDASHHHHVHATLRLLLLQQRMYNENRSIKCREL